MTRWSFWCMGASGALVLAACSGAPSMVMRPDSAAYAPDASPPELGSDAARDAAGCSLGLSLTSDQCEKVRALALPADLPPSAGNLYADLPAAATLGFLVFYDPRFSPLPEVRCATCHLPENSFGDGKSVSQVVEGRPLLRNSPSMLNAAWSGPFYFWDGRADSLWSQPLVAFENPDEMASSRLKIAHTLFETPTYKKQFEQLFGPLPDLADTARFPPEGKPGDPSFDTMAPEDAEAVNRTVVNLGKAIEAYLRKLATGESALDAFLAGDRAALTHEAQQGLTVFARAGCIDCHGGPALTDHAFHDVGTANGDRGRATGLPLLLASPFNSDGPYFDRDAGFDPILPTGVKASDEGAFRTPSLRNLPRTAPYGHAGSFATIEDLLASGHGKQLTEQERTHLTIFLLALNGTYPERPWSDWPAR